MSRANLKGADLTAAVLRSAKLIAANFELANLTDADFTKADLRGSRISSAHMERTILVSAIMDAADSQKKPSVQDRLKDAASAKADAPKASSPRKEAPSL